MAREFEASQDRGLVDRLWSNCEIVEGLEYDAPEKVIGPCWESTYAPNASGYCYIGWWVDGHQINLRAHRFAWAVDRREEIGEGYQINHYCDNRCCINPEHLWRGTQEENLQDAVEKGRVSTTHQVSPSGEDSVHSHLTWEIIFMMRRYCNGRSFKNPNNRISQRELTNWIVRRYGIQVSEGQTSLILRSDSNAEHPNNRQWLDLNWDPEYRVYVGPPVNWQEDWGDWQT